jgi:single-stranded DNA-binding protein
MAEIGKLVGNIFACNAKLVRDAEVKDTKKGKVVELRVVNNPDFGDGDGLFFDVPLWGEKAPEIFGGMKKGDAVWCTGKLVPRSYENKQGNKVQVLSLKFGEVTRLAKKDTSAASAPQNTPEDGGDEDPTAEL